MNSVCFQGKPFNITVIQVYAPTSNAEAEVEWFYEDLQDLLELTPPKNVHYRRLECTSRKLRNTWSNRQIWPWSTEWSRAKTNRVLPREHTGHSKHPLPTTQREDSTHGHLQMVNTEIRLIIFFAAEDGEALCSQQKTRLGAEYGSYHELLIDKLRLKLKKIGEITRHLSMT